MYQPWFKYGLGYLVMTAVIVHEIADDSHKGVENMTLPYFQVDTRNEHLKTLARRHSSLWDEFNDKLILSWIYHDHGLEGVVLQPHELMDALSEKSVPDNSSQMLYLDIHNLQKAITLIEEYVKGKKLDDRVNKSFVQALYQQLTHRVRGVPDGNGLRQEDGRYGAYYHKCCPHEEVEAKLRKLLTMYNQLSETDQHPMVHAAQFHFAFMKAMPFGRFSGRIVRLLTNLLLMRYDYPPAIVHTVERARYYEALAQDDERLLLNLLSESINSTVEGGLQFLQQGIAERRRKREARKARKLQRESTQSNTSTSSRSTSSRSSSSKTKGRKREAAKKNTPKKLNSPTAKSTSRKSNQSQKTS